MGHSLRHGRAQRGGFTLIEILVVIGIITILVTLTASATIRFIATQQVKNTEATIYKVNSELSRQWAEVIKVASKESPCVTAQEMANNDPNIARVIHVKLRLKQEFPMNYYEVFVPVVDPISNMPDPTLPPIQEYVDQLKAVGIMDITDPRAMPTTVPTQDENSACLAMALRRNRGGKGTNADDLLGTGVVATNAIGLKIINDAWEQPIVFYRWATANPEVDASGPAANPNSNPPIIAARRDTQDPEGRLQDPNWFFNGGGQAFQAQIHSLSNGNNLYAYYMPPIIASGGPDMKLGIAPDAGVPSMNSPQSKQPNPMTQFNANNANDNLYSFRLRLGGKGD
jgi:prepilin-type N-terminal cleavage/methylation domain-containing protein